MSIAIGLIAAFCCAQAATPPPAAPKSATSRITSVTIHRSQAVVSREVSVPAGEGTTEVVVGPLPDAVDAASVSAEGTEAIQVLGARVRTRELAVDRRAETAEIEEKIRKLQAEGERLKMEAGVLEKDQGYLSKLEGFTGTSLNGLTEKGRFDAEAVVALSKYLMETRSTKAKAESDLHERMKENADAVGFAQRRQAALQTTPSKSEREAVIVVRRAKPEAGTIRLEYLVRSVSWSPRYRLRGSLDDKPVALEYLAAISQKTGEDWNGVELKLSTAEPSLDAAPPDLLPLKMAIGPVVSSKSSSEDPANREILAKLEQKITLQYPQETPLEDVIKYILSQTKGPGSPNGLPLFVDPNALQEAERTLTSPVTIDLENVPLKTGLRLALSQLGLGYVVDEGVVRIYAKNSDDDPDRGSYGAYGGMGMGGMPGGMGGMGGGMGGMGRFGGGAALELSQAFGEQRLNGDAAGAQERELVADARNGEGDEAERELPTVAFTVPGKVDLASGNDGQILEVARVELKPEYYAKAVPVLTPRVYRLAKLTNTGPTVLLPGEASVYVGRDYVGRMRLPLVASGEPFVAGFGVDPQVQVSRRMIKKTRTIQGGNQVYNYEFRIGLRNFRSTPVKVQLWDRLPKSEGETAAAALVKTSVEISADPMYLRTTKLDNLLRWDVDLPAETIGEKTKYVDYEFKLEYSKDAAKPKFLSAGLREDAIGGGAMGGLGGIGGGFRSVEPK